MAGHKSGPHEQLVSFVRVTHITSSGRHLLLFHMQGFIVREGEEFPSLWKIPPFEYFPLLNLCIKIRSYRVGCLRGNDPKF